MSSSDSTQLRAEIVGLPVGQSLSPRIFRKLNELRAGAQPGIEYGRREVTPSELTAVFHRVRAEGLMRGWNVTAPHKEAVLALLDELDESARAVRAVNVVRFEAGRTRGFNTDVMGIERALSEAGVRVGGAPVRVLGAGGAAKAAVIAVARQGAREITLVSRTVARAEAVRMELSGKVSGNRLRVDPRDGGVSEACSRGEIVIQATPDPKSSVSGELRLGGLENAACAFDLVYRPRRTVFLKKAEELGVQTVEGVGMLIHQAIGSWEIWQAQSLDPADRDRIAGILREELVAAC